VPFREPNPGGFLATHQYVPAVSFVLVFALSSARIPPFSTGGLAEQLGTREYCADPFFRRKSNCWLSEIKTLWPECPATVSKDAHILVLNSSKKNPAISCGRPSESISLSTET